MKTINVAKQFWLEQTRLYRARCSWETWIDSWAGKLWIERHRAEITQIYEAEKARWSWNRKYILGI